MAGRKKRMEADGWLVAGLHPCPPLLVSCIQGMLSAPPMRCFISMASKGRAVNIHFVSATVHLPVVVYPSSFCNHQNAHLARWWCVLHCGQREGHGGNARGGTRRCHNVTEGTCAASMDQVVTLTLRMLLPVLAAMMAVPR